jgi:RimJ/RimL family protein N-acetyltransferase
VALPLLSGQRLRLVPASHGQLKFFCQLNADQQVMQHVSGEPTSRVETEAEWAQRLGPRSDVNRGLGYWTGYLDGGPIGWWGLGYNQAQPEAGELGFRVRREHWRQGLGLEGARLLIDHGFSTAGVTHIWAGTVRANAASRATLTSVGMACTDEPKPDVLTYEITLDQWLQLGCRAAHPGRIRRFQYASVTAQAAERLCR